jgi:hypothetical protein
VDYVREISKGESHSECEMQKALASHIIISSLS